MPARTPPSEFDEQRIAKADVVVLILGHCYGSSPPGQELSYTELEYEAALGLKRPLLAFVADDDFPLKRAWIETDDRRKRQEALRDRVLNGPDKTIAKLFEPDPDRLGGYVTQALFNWRGKAATAIGEACARPVQCAATAGPHRPGGADPGAA